MEEKRKKNYNLKSKSNRIKHRINNNILENINTVKNNNDIIENNNNNTVDNNNDIVENNSNNTVDNNNNNNAGNIIISQNTTKITTKIPRKRKAPVNNTTAITTKKPRKRKAPVNNTTTISTNTTSNTTSNTTTTKTKNKRVKMAVSGNEDRIKRKRPYTKKVRSVYPDNETDSVQQNNIKANTSSSNSENTDNADNNNNDNGINIDNKGNGNDSTIDNNNSNKDNNDGSNIDIDNNKSNDYNNNIDNSNSNDNNSSNCENNNNDSNYMDINDSDNTDKRSTKESIDINNEVDYDDEDLYNEDESHRFIKLLANIDLRSINELPKGSFARNKKVIEEALHTNEKLQYLIEDQIEKIDERLEKNDELIKIARLLSIREARAKRNKIDIHRPYRKTKKRFDYFKEFHGVDLQDEDKEENQDVERPRAWQTREREALSTAIQTEVQRITAYGHLSRNEAWRVWEVDNIPKKEWENFPVNKLDWNRISSLYVKTRTPMECMIQWTTQDHPSINKKPWSKKESETLRQLVKENGYEGKWEKIASQLNTNRTASQCFSHYQAESNALDAKRPWTKDDDEALKEAVSLVGDKNWQQVASIIGGRSGQQCLHRWEKSINPAIRRSRWTEEEDNALRGAVDVYGVGNWTSIQRYLPGRTDMQCRERWMNCLDPRINHDAFTEEVIFI
ncbi:unnamed protein product [Cunninghamella blakesleeana]